MLTQSKAALKSIGIILSSCLFYNALSSVWETPKKFIAGIKTFPISKLVGFKHTTSSINYPRRADTRRSNSLDNTDFMEIGR